MVKDLGGACDDHRKCPDRRSRLGFLENRGFAQQGFSLWNETNDGSFGVKKNILENLLFEKDHLLSRQLFSHANLPSV